MASSEKITLSWTNFNVNVPDTFRSLWNKTDFSDVTLVTTDQKQLQAHKLVLGAASQFFRGVLINNPHPHPLIYLKDVTHTDLKLILQFIYLGKCQVPHGCVERFLEVGKQLYVGGLIGEVSGEKEGEVFDDQESVKPELKNNHSEVQKKENTSDENDLDKMMLIFETKENNATSENCIDFSSLCSTINTQDNIPHNENGNFLEKTSFQAHTIKFSDRFEHTEKMFPCNECGTSYKTFSKLQIHIGVKPENVKYQCDKCDFVSGYTQHLRHHKAAKHNRNKYRCGKCNHKVLTTRALRQHQIRKHGETQIQDDLTEQLKIVNNQKMPCDECGKYVKRISIKMHARNVHNRTNFMCNECGRSFSSHNMLQIHVGVRHDNINYPCDQCEFKSGYKTKLKEHIETKHEGKLHSCGKCDHQFTYMNALRSHLKMKHSEMGKKLDTT